MLSFGNKITWSIVASAMVVGSTFIPIPAFAHESEHGARHGHYDDGHSRGGSGSGWAGNPWPHDHHSHHHHGDGLSSTESSHFPAGHLGGYYGGHRPGPPIWSHHHHDHPFYYLNSSVDSGGCHPEWRYDWLGKPYRKVVCDY